MTAEDECFVFGDFHPRSGFSAGPVNNLIFNFKKPVTKRGLPEYVHKERAIVEVAGHVRRAFNDDAIEKCTFVPIPPSKAKTDPLYDDRLVRSLSAVSPAIDVRELLTINQSMRAHHEFVPGEKRPTPDDVYKLLSIDEGELRESVREKIILFDDVLTNGTHFKVCKRRLSERLPGHAIYGVFIGRSKRPDAADEFEVIIDL